MVFNSYVSHNCSTPDLTGSVGQKADLIPKIMIRYYKQSASPNSKTGWLLIPKLTCVKVRRERETKRKRERWREKERKREIYIYTYTQNEGDIFTAI